jgi:hypothetical protein
MANRQTPRWGRFSTGRGGHLLTPRTAGRVLIVHASPVWAWQERNGDHVCEKRCSGLDLLGCDPGLGYAAQDLRTRRTEVAYGSLLLRDGVRAAPSSSPVVCRIVGAPPLDTPARVIPCRTLWEGKGRAGYRASPQVQNTRLFRWRWPAGVPVPVPPETWSAHLPGRDQTVISSNQQPKAPGARRPTGVRGRSPLAAQSTATVPRRRAWSLRAS